MRLSSVRLAAAAITAVAATALGASPAASAAPNPFFSIPSNRALLAAMTGQTSTLDLATGYALRIDGAAAGDQLDTPRAAGDVNGDGHPDLVVSAPGASNNGRAGSGSVYVIFGPLSGKLDLAHLGAGGYRIDGPVAGAHITAAGTVGDDNGDHRADILIRTGDTAYVVFGKSTSTTVDLASTTWPGYRILAAPAPTDQFHPFAAFNVAPAGDVNGDGRGDVVVGQPGVLNRAFVVYGTSANTTIALASLIPGTPSSQGFAIAGPNPEGRYPGDTQFGAAVAGAGDVNGDGYGDVVIGDPELTSSGGSATVLLGPTGARGFTIRDDTTESLDGSRTGQGVGAGDVNGDGRSDVFVAEGASTEGGSPGLVGVVFGTTSPHDVFLRSFFDELWGPDGFRIGDGPGCDNISLGVTAGRSDINGDGFADVIVNDYTGNTFSPPSCNPAEATPPSRIYVVYGKTSTSDLVPRASLPPGTGFAIDPGGVPSPTLPFSTGTSGGATVGDFTVPGFADIGVGAPRESENGRPESGSAYVVGFVMPQCTITASSQRTTVNGTAGNDVICAGAATRTVNGNGGNDILIGGPGNETLNGGPGVDALIAGSGNDVLNGFGGNDLLVGGPGADTLNAGPGYDILIAGPGRSTLDGGPDIDACVPGPHTVLVRGCP